MGEEHRHHRGGDHEHHEHHHGEHHHGEHHHGHHGEHPHGHGDHPEFDPEKPEFCEKAEFGKECKTQGLYCEDAHWETADHKKKGDKLVCVPRGASKDNGGKGWWKV